MLSVAAATVSFLGVQLVWIVHRRLPTLTEVDLSSRIFGAADSGSVRVVALGDSTLTGPGLSDPSKIWLSQAICLLAPVFDVELISLAVGGSRVADIGGQIERVVELGPALVVLNVGANDVLHGTPHRRFIADFDALLTSLVERVPVVAVTNIGDLGTVARAPRPLSNALRIRSRSFSGAIERIVAAHDQAVLLDVTPADIFFGTRDMFGDDLYHASEIGHFRWAEATTSGLRVAFDRLSLPESATCEAPSALHELRDLFR